MAAVLASPATSMIVLGLPSRSLQRNNDRVGARRFDVHALPTLDEALLMLESEKPQVFVIGEAPPGIDNLAWRHAIAINKGDHLVLQVGNTTDDPGPFLHVTPGVDLHRLLPYLRECLAW